MMGLCPLHEDHKPSFLVDTNKDLFYCYGCGRGGDAIRFAELYHQVKFPQAVALLHQWRGAEPSLLLEAARFYRIQLHRHSEAVAYLYQRGIRSSATIELMHIGYAPGGCLRRWLNAVGLLHAGSVSGRSRDRQRIRRICAPDRLSAGRQSLWTQPFRCGTSTPVFAGRQRRLVCLGASPAISGSDSRRGLIRLCRAWEAGFQNATCSLGVHLNARQFRQLCDAPRTVYLTFDADRNGSGQQAAQCLSQNLRQRGITPRLVSLPDGHDPNSFFVHGGGDAHQFQALLDGARS